MQIRVTIPDLPFSHDPSEFRNGDFNEIARQFMICADRLRLRLHPLSWFIDHIELSLGSLEPVLGRGFDTAPTCTITLNRALGLDTNGEPFIIHGPFNLESSTDNRAVYQNSEGGNFPADHFIAKVSELVTAGLGAQLRRFKELTTSLDDSLQRFNSQLVPAS